MDDDYRFSESTVVSISPGVGWGLAGLLIGCSLLVSACSLMAFNMLLFQHGLRGVDMKWAQRGVVIGIGGVAFFGLFAVWCGIHGWNCSARRGESGAFGIAGLVAGAVGFVAWSIAGLDALAILNVIEA